MRRVLPFVAALAGPAFAHPHVFVDAKAGFRMDNEGRLTALRITWTYDAFSSLVLFDQLALDPDGDGELDDADRAKIVRGETDWPPEYEGDTYLDLGGATVELGRPEGGVAWMAEDRVSVAFDLPIADPLAAPDGARLRLYDPVYYYAYDVVGAEVDGTCSARIDPFVADAATSRLQATLAALSREETPDRDDVGALFADAVILACD